MDVNTWSLYASAVLLLCLTPGPNSLLAVTNGLRFGVGKTLVFDPSDARRGSPC